MKCLRTLLVACGVEKWLAIALACAFVSGCSCEKRPHTPTDSAGASNPPPTASAEASPATQHESQESREKEKAEPDSASASENASGESTETSSTTARGDVGEGGAAKTETASGSGANEGDEETTASGRQSGAPRLSASEARRRVERHRENARRAANRGDYGTAFNELLEAWDALEGHRDSPAFRDLSTQVLGELETFGEAANRAAGRNTVPLDDRDVTIQ